MQQNAHDLARMSRFKRTEHAMPGKIGAPILDYFKQTLEKRHKKFGCIADVWLTIVPADLQAQAELATFSRGTLGIIVEGSSTLFRMKQALLAGLEQQLVLSCRGQGLKKIVVKSGRISADQ